MKPSAHIELSALIATQTHSFLRGPQPATHHLNDYWTQAKCLHGHWHEVLKQYGDQLAGGVPKRSDWGHVRQVIEEVLFSEMLTRVWGAMATAYDHRHGCGDIEPVVQSVFQSHVEINGRALSLLVYGEGVSMNEAVRLNQLRRRIERWTDLILGALMLETDADAYAFDADRVMDYFDEMRQKNAAQRHLVWQLQLNALRTAFAGYQTISPYADLHRKIAASVIGCFPAELFDSTGLFKSLWLERLEIVASDTQGLIDELFSLHFG